jgi:holo-[acyl-carrier protein] synthase
MIRGLGVDLIEVDRVLEKIAKDQGFRERIFSANEIRFCSAQVHEGENYAGRNLCDIEVVNDEMGKPSLVLHGTFKEAAIKNKWNTIHLSISHLKATACAVVIIEQ